MMILDSGLHFSGYPVYRLY